MPTIGKRSSGRRRGRDIHEKKTPLVCQFAKSWKIHDGTATIASAASSACNEAAFNFVQDSSAEEVHIID